MTKKVMKRHLLCALLLSGSVMCLAQETRTISGQVTDSNDASLVGATVVVAGTTIGTVTDADGRYRLTVPADATNLRVSYIGYDDATVAISGSEINVLLLEDLLDLEEIVVVGYGSMERKDVTSSITTVRAEDLNVGAFSSPAELLQGKIPGLVITNSSNPNGSSSISLRGASSLREGAAMEPYYIVDGVPGVSLSLVAPEDIESIDVLRDATATAIYGSKAANGIIIVTTKKGNTEGRTKVSYSGYVAMDRAMNTLDMMDAKGLLGYLDNYNVDYVGWYNENVVAAYNATVEKEEDKMAELEPIDIVDTGYDTDWQDEVLRTGVTQNHNVSINGGNGKSVYSASITYQDKEGVLRGTERKRLNLRSYLKTSTLRDRLDVAVSLTAAVDRQKSVPADDKGASVTDAMYYFSPLNPVRTEDGEWSYGSATQCYNPVSMIEEDRYVTREKMWQASAIGTLHILDGLDYNLQLSYENEQVIESNYNSTKSQLPDTNHGRASRKAVENVKKQAEMYLNFDRTFADAHKVGLMLGYSWEQDDDNDGFGVSVSNFYDDALEYYNVEMANKIDRSSVKSSLLSTLRMISFYGRLNYGYRSRYLVQATFRRDGSSAFGENEQWGTFPSVSVAWRLSEEGFLQNQGVLSDLKLRLGYGVSGNSLGFDAYTACKTYGSNGSTFTGSDGNEYISIAATRNANEDLKWEKTSMLNVGLDFAFWGGRLGGTIEYYSKNTDDLIYDYTVSNVSYPYSEMTANVGEISNKGFELSLNATPVRGNKFRWETSLNLSHNVNEVERISNSKYSVDYINLGSPEIAGESNTSVQRLVEGEAVGTFYLWEWAGRNENGVSIYNDYDDEGNLVGTTDSPDDGDRRKAGCAQPKLTYGWNNSLSFGGWYATLFFQGVAGNDIFNAVRAQYNSNNLATQGKNVLREIATTQDVRDVHSGRPSDRYLEKGGYFRLSNLTVGYDFRNLGDWLQDIKVYATCNNVFTITDYEGIDPELSLGGLTPGIDWRTTGYPRARTIMFGLNVNF